MIVARKIDDRQIYLKLSLLNEESVFQDGFTKCNTAIVLPPINEEKSTETKDKVNNKNIICRYPKNNPSVHRIFKAITKGNWDEVDFSMQYVFFQDGYFDNQTAAIASLFCTNPVKRKHMIKTLMKWKCDFTISDIEFQRDPLHWCCILGYKEEFDIIVDHLNGDVDYQKKDIDGNTYLHLSVMSDSLDLVKSILNTMTVNEISADISNSLGFTPYILSRKLGYREISSLIQSTPIASMNVFDNMLYKSPREWSILGHNMKIKSHRISKTTNHNNQVKTFKIPEIVVENPLEKKILDVNKIIHSAYIVWANQHVDSFRKLAQNREKLISKSKVFVPLPLLNKKTRVK